MPKRNFKSPKYVAWRKAVFVRDNFKCKMPGCHGVDKRLNAHHIRKWSSYPELRYVVSNGITLCRTCHKKICGLEEDYEALFLRIVNRPKSDVALKLMLMRNDKAKE